MRDDRRERGWGKGEKGKAEDGGKEDLEAD